MGKFYYQYLMYALILIILVFVSWFLIRDIFAGIIFRIKHNLRNGSFIKAGEFSGQIKSQQVTCLKIITDDNRLLRVPYSRLVNAVISEASGRGTVEEHLIHVKIDASIGKTNAETFIRNALLSNPWNNLKEEPAVRYQKENENGYFYDITLLSKNLKHIKNIEMALEEIPSIHII
jgi:small-conductance mechanosensitive channel